MTTTARTYITFPVDVAERLHGRTEESFADLDGMSINTGDAEADLENAWDMCLYASLVAKRLTRDEKERIKNDPVLKAQKARDKAQRDYDAALAAVEAAQEPVTA